jgi:mono/diheme cytochrome c family protein
MSLRAALLGLAALGAGALLVHGGLSAEAKRNPYGRANADVGNFMLVDQAGVGHELYYAKAAPAVVIVSHALGDAASERAVEAVKALRATYAGKGVEFMLLNASEADTRQSIAAAVGDLDLPILDDELQLVARGLGVTETAEAFVIDPKTWKVAYHGPIDKTFAPRGRSKGSVAAALDAMLAGEKVKVVHADTAGAPIEIVSRDEYAGVTYVKDVAPILAANCVVCHSEGGMGPFPMNSYEMVRGFAPMIEEVIRTKRMPPFHADPHYGEWANDMNLSQREILTLVNWVDGGAVRGEGEDPLAAANYKAPEWPYGEPDHIVSIPGFDVPATGTVDYQDWSIANPLTEGKWLRTTAWKAGARETVHHVLAGWIPEVRADGRGFSWNTSLGGYGPGGDSNLTPEDTGIYVPPGGSFAFQVHYTPVGRPLRDETKVGLYFYDEEPKYILRQASVTDFSIKLPAGAGRHHERAYLEFPHDALIYGTQPHAHYRGYATKLTLRYPDGTERILLNQPRYDFAWQREYIFKELLEVPAGSKLIADYIFDNSTANPANPDPSIDVTFGEQSWQEMLFTFVRYRWKDETSTDRKDEYQQALNNNILFGALDDDIDGRLVMADLRDGPQLKLFRDNFARIDMNKDGAIDKQEMATAQAFMAQMRNRGGQQQPAAGLEAQALGGH